MWWTSRRPALLGAGLCAVLGVACLLPGSALGLPSDRAYEMVSPVYKSGFGATGITAVAPDGESMAFGSGGAFAGALTNNGGGQFNKYMARRSSDGWIATPLLPPAAVAPYGGLLDFSPDMRVALDEGALGPNDAQAADEGTEFEYLLDRTDVPYASASYEVAGTVLTAPDKKQFRAGYLGASPDFSHILFLGGKRGLLPAAVNTNSDLYDMVTQVGGAASLRLVGVNNKGKAIVPICAVGLGAGTGKVGAYAAVAMGGKAIFFTTELEAGVTGECPRQLFVRLDGARTLEVSRPLLPVCHEVPCAGAVERKPAEYQGASEDGSLVFFTTQQSLVSEDKDVTNDLYMAGIGCPVGEEGCEVSKREVVSLTEVSHGGEPADVQGAVAVAHDGSRVYFVARGVLSEGANGNGSTAVAGADNLYVYDSATKALAFVAELCSGPGISGPQNDPREDLNCPSGLASGLASNANDTSLWTRTSPRAQIAEGERFLLFSSYGRLAGGDTDGGSDLYRYDPETGSLERVSVGEAGYDANGNGEGFDATIYTSDVSSQYQQRHMNSRAIAADGSRVVFTSSEPLSSLAINGQANVYEWLEGAGPGGGSVSLVSSGSADAGVEQVVISSSGSDIFFATSQSLVSQDVDGQPDIYDARLGGGFPAPAALREPCSGDACQGPLTDPAPLLVPGSAIQAPGGNVSTPPERVIPVKKKKAKRPSVRKKRRRGTAKGRRSARAKKTSGVGGRR